MPADQAVRVATYSNICTQLAGAPQLGTYPEIATDVAQLALKDWLSILNTLKEAYRHAIPPSIAEEAERSAAAFYADRQRLIRDNFTRVVYGSPDEPAEPGNTQKP